MRIAAPLLAIGAAWILLLLRVGPVPTWFYVFVWYPTLLVLDAVAVRLGRPSLFANRGTAVSLFLWSPVVWLVFEAANFRLENWYYVQLPRLMWERWLGILLSFATVVPALVLAERVLEGAGVFRTLHTRPVRVRPWDLHASVALGCGTGLLALVKPETFFPLIWGAALLIADPIVYRRAPRLSLFRDIERGEWGRTARLLAGGLAVGILWETFNYWAQGKWIYTVPWLEDTKFFEMPPLGLLGFPIFALEAWAMYAALSALGVAVPVSGAGWIVRRRVVISGLVAAAFVVATLVGMNHFTISSTVPRLAEVPGMAADQVASVRAARIRSTLSLAEADAERLVADAGLEPAVARRLVASARLVTLRGIGTEHAHTLARLDVHSVCELARSNGDELTRAIRRTARGPRPTPAEIRVWIRAAQRACMIDILEVE